MQHCPVCTPIQISYKNFIDTESSNKNEFEWTSYQDDHYEVVILPHNDDSSSGSTNDSGVIIGNDQFGQCNIVLTDAVIESCDPDEPNGREEQEEIYSRIGSIRRNELEYNENICNNSISHIYSTVQRPKKKKQENKLYESVNRIDTVSSNCEETPAAVNGGDDGFFETKEDCHEMVSFYNLT